MRIIVRFVIAFSLLLTPVGVFAQDIPNPVLSAQGVAIYGWKDGASTMLYQKKQGWLFSVASITKLATAKTVEQLYSSEKVFTLPVPISLSGSQRAPVGAQISRDDLLRSLLISSSNDAGGILADTIGRTHFLTTLNNFLNTEKYTSTSFRNVTGLDPKDKTLTTNRMTPFQVSRLISEVYQHDKLLTGILSQKEATITDQKTGKEWTIRSSNEINYEPSYADRIILSKTGRTNRAGENLVFVTKGYGDFDYLTVTILGSKSRYNDGKAVLDWIEKLSSR